jgi:hypothetical protein
MNIVHGRVGRSSNMGATVDSGGCGVRVWAPNAEKVASLGQDRPGDVGQLIGERSCQNVVMQPFRRGRQPRPKAMLCPICWPEQNDAGVLHEQRAQIAIATLADAAEDRPIACGHLLRHQAESGGKVASFGKGSSIGNGRDHRARDERAWSHIIMPISLRY